MVNLLNVIQVLQGIHHPEQLLGRLLVELGLVEALKVTSATSVSKPAAVRASLTAAKSSGAVITSREPSSLTTTSSAPGFQRDLHDGILVRSGLEADHSLFGEQVGHRAVGPQVAAVL